MEYKATEKIGRVWSKVKESSITNLRRGIEQVKFQRASATLRQLGEDIYSRAGNDTWKFGQTSIQLEAHGLGLNWEIQKTKDDKPVFNGRFSIIAGSVNLAVYHYDDNGSIKDKDTTLVVNNEVYCSYPALAVEEMIEAIGSPDKYGADPAS